MLPTMQNPRLVRVFIMDIGNTRLSARIVPIFSRGTKNFLGEGIQRVKGQSKGCLSRLYTYTVVGN